MRFIRGLEKLTKRLLTKKFGSTIFEVKRFIPDFPLQSPRLRGPFPSTNHKAMVEGKSERLSEPRI